MEFNKCSRCGNFYVSQGDVCPKCVAKDTFEFSNFQKYVEENGLNSSLDVISGKTGILVKNLNRYVAYGNTIKNSSSNHSGIAPDKSASTLANLE